MQSGRNMTKTTFCQKATGQPVAILNMPLTAVPTIHSKGSCGWSKRFACFIEVDGEWVKVLGNLTLTAVGSKKWEK